MIRPIRRRAIGAIRAVPASGVRVLAATAYVLGLSAIAAPAQSAAEECVSGEPDPPTSVGWAQTDLGVDALAEGFQGWNVSIAVIGSGVDARHPALSRHVAAGQGVGTEAEPLQDCLGVGTAVAGAAAAAPINGSSLSGVAPQALVVPIRVPDFMANPQGELSEDDRVLAERLLAEAIVAALDEGVRVIVLPSLSVSDSQQLRQVMARAEQQGVLLIEGAPTTFSEATAFPLAYPEVLGVIGVDEAGAPVETAVPSELLDLSAPGSDIVALAPGGYAVESGSPLAAGVVAGVGALMLDTFVGTTPAQIREKLTASAIGATEPGRPPAISPAAALGPLPEPAREPPSVPWRTSSPQQAIEMAPRQATVILIGCAVLLVLGALGAGAYVRGRRRAWRPARPTDPEELIKRVPKRSI